MKILKEILRNFGRADYKRKINDIIKKSCTYKILLMFKIITYTYKILLMFKIITCTYKR